MARTQRKRISILDEGIEISPDVDSLDFTGSGITGTAFNDDVEEEVEGGGGFTLPALLSGSVLFSDGVTIAEDNTNFNWNNTGKELNISGVATERLTNGNFASGSTGWTVTSGWVISGGVATHSSNGTASLTQGITAKPGLLYKVVVEVLNHTVGTLTITYGNVVIATVSANGTYTYKIRATGTNGLTLAPSNTARLAVDNMSVIEYTGGVFGIAGKSYFGDKQTISISASNTSPGTVDHMELHNPSGNYTHISYRFGSTIVAGITGLSGGTIEFRTTGSTGLSHYHGATIGSGSLVTQLTSGGVYSNGYGVFAGKVSAGSGSTTTPKSTHNIFGSSAAKGRLVSASGLTLGDETFVYFDTTSSVACGGTASVSCSTYSTEANCIARNAHGGCLWTAYTCSDYNGDETQCSLTPGCSWEMASCSGIGDESSCNGTSGCSWSSLDCAGIGDEGTCNGTSGCSWGGGADCSSSFFDEESCNGQSGCSWDGMTCNGTYGDSCSGTYGTCEGSYPTGNCVGTGGACSGTAACSGIGNSTDCGNETGCTWSTNLAFSLPQGSTVVDGLTTGRHAWFKKAVGSGNVVINAFAGDDIDGSSSLTISTLRNATHLHMFPLTAACTAFNDNESSCNAQAGCGFTNTCIAQVDEMSCLEVAGCSWNGSSCEGDSGICSGTYVTAYRWHIVSEKD